MLHFDVSELPDFPRKIVILGATGSIGSQALEIVRKYPDLLQVVGISGYHQVDELAVIQNEFSVPHVGLAASEESTSFTGHFGGAKMHTGKEGLVELASLEQADLVLVALVGTAGLEPTLAAIEAKKTIALANKEVLVMAGKFVTQAARENGCLILPVDSEHNALFQCAQAAHDATSEIEKLILTGSGGSFRERPLDQFASITVEEALNHPNWDMGQKVTIDSATMANKGLELIEAKWLFNLRPDQLEVTIHRQSIVHSMVQFCDGSILGQLSPPSMTFPIQHCLLYPERRAPVQPTLSFQESLNLDFSPVDFERYPCLKLAYAAMDHGGVAETVFNAANEVAVAAFVAGELPFLRINQVIEQTLAAIPITDPSSLDAVLDADQQARRRAQELLTPTLC
ncbi:MAG: 1-deoxy-D-xylulose-5-phosphate reductoisomerase [Opitutales bacterium]|nr:1-deoxy-D-xylulose-5-phosphate reductoisomerase [Opitutales bacterium]NRA26775.1 1-deoxy-D-xylulose-5-phosphate reductoisomerase [Opitutales bacterium]